MKSLIFVLIALIAGLNCYSLKAQTGWNFQNNPLDNGIGIGKIQFVSPTEGWISATHGILLHSTDTGVNWNIVSPFSTDTVCSMSDPAITMWWVDQTHGWKINWLGTNFDDAHGAVIHLTTDGGNTWQKKVLSTTIGEIGLQVQFVDNLNGWASIYNLLTGDFRIMRSMDGGNEWNQISTSGGIFYFIDLNNGWAITDNVILKTSDGGVNWTSQYTDNTPGNFNAIQFTDLNNGWVVGENGKVIKTNDGGNNWTQVINTNISSVSNNKSVFFLNSNVGWIANSEPDWPGDTIIHTMDGGTSWTHQDPNLINGSVFSIFFQDENNGWFTGEQCVQNCSGPDSLMIWAGIISHTTNGGLTGAKENLIKNQIRIYPNPASDIITLDLTIVNNVDLTLNIYDVIGTLVKSEMVKQNQQQIKIGDLSNGIYMIEVKSKELNWKQKLIIKR
jgi:photosystem II stability/assembly factor-like uncharacterized protein